MVIIAASKLFLAGPCYGFHFLLVDIHLGVHVFLTGLHLVLMGYHFSSVGLCLGIHPLVRTT
jgi:hypothetical protein